MSAKSGISGTMKNIELCLVCIASFGAHKVNGLSLGGIRNETSVEEETPSSAETATLIKEFRNENMELLTEDYLLSHNFIVGVLRAKKWNKVEASKYLQKILKWRTNSKIEELGQESVDPELLEYFPWVIEGISKMGCPVVRVDFGEWYVDEYMLGQEYVHDANKAFRRYYSMMTEKCLMAVKNVVPQCDQSFVFMDMKNFTMKNIAESNSLNGIIQIVTLLETYYPNSVRSIIVFNGSEQFTTFLESISPFMPLTAKALTVYMEEETEKARQHILSVVDADQLPPRYFGNKDIL